MSSGTIRSRVVLFGVGLAVAAAVALALAPAGTAAGWWTFRDGFNLLRWSVYLGLAGAAVSLAGGLLGRRWRLAAAGIVLGLAVAAVPWMLQRSAREVPPIHDITTDMEEPPGFVAVLPLRADAPNPPEYAGSEVAEQQRRAYPDIRPLTVQEPPEVAFERALAAARDMGWEIVAADPADGRIEAVATTFWFRFRDDVVIRVREDVAGTRIDARSKSRVGRGDAGANARRIRRFLERAGTGAPGGPPPGPVRGQSFQDAREAGTARLTFFYVPSSGFAYRDDEGNLTGVTVELLRDFARFVEATHDIAIEEHWIEEERWADFYRYVRGSEGGVFGIGNVTITDARREELDFSPPYLDNIAVLVTHEDVPELTSMDAIGEAFADLTALPYPGTLHEQRLAAIRERYLPDMPERPVASNDELVTHLASGEGYFGYIDVYNYWRAREVGRPLRRHAVADDASETFGVILPHRSDWTPVIEAFFDADGGYVESERYRGLMRRHLGEELASLLTRGQDRR